MKRILSLLSSSLIVLLFVQVVHAGGLTLNTIGELDVTGTSYSQYWYTGSTPDLTGTAPANNAVTFTVNGQPGGTVTADTSGNWSHTLTLSDGDNDISISTEGMNPYTFTLTMGSPPEGTGGMTPSDMPAAGNGNYTVVFLGLSMLAIAISSFVLKKI